MKKENHKKEQESRLAMDCSRRDFMRGSAAVAAGLAVGGMFTSCAATPRSVAQAAQVDPLLLALKEAARNFMRSPLNDMELSQPEPLFGDPIFGVASGADPLWMVYKETAVGNFHWTPREAFLLAYPGETAVMPEELSIIAYAIPQTQATRDEQRPMDFLPGDRWIRTRWIGEWNANVPIRRAMLAELANRNIQAVAPYLLPEYSGGLQGPFAHSSTWSERHVAFAAGLGTFGLSDGLITEVGKAHRVGSVVLRARLEPTQRPYTSRREYCPFFTDGSCGICMQRCPTGSIRPEGRNKVPCFNHQMTSVATHIGEKFGHDERFTFNWACGLCQVGVPCESRIPPGIPV
jgi:NAD-dependent dihydropyrimidine dehydrogenase PreA subunit